MSDGPQDDVGGSGDGGEATPPPFTPEGPAVGATGPAPYPGPAPGAAGPPPSYPGPPPAGPGGPPSYPPPGGPAYPPPEGPHYGPPATAPPYAEPGVTPGYPPPGYPPPGYGPPGYPPPFAAPAQGGFEVGPPPLAPYGTRLGGWIIDWLLLLVVGFVVNRIFNNVHVGLVHFHTTSSSGVVTYYHVSSVGLLIQALIVILYGGLLCGSKRGQTVGMMAVRVRAFDAGTGEPIGYGRGLWRGFFEYLLFVLFIIPWVIDMLFPLWDWRNQTLHDKVSGTVVVRIPPRPLTA